MSRPGISIKMKARQASGCYPPMAKPRRNSPSRREKTPGQGGRPTASSSPSPASARATTLLQLWAAQGYVIGCVNFHGSSGYGQNFTDSITGAMGEKPLADIMKSTDWFASQPWIDKNRMAAAGASYGGYMMAWLNGHTDRFQAMVCHAGVYDWHAMLASDFIRGRFRALGAPPGVTSRSSTASPPSASPPTSKPQPSSCTAKKTSASPSPRDWPISTR